MASIHVSQSENFTSHLTLSYKNFTSICTELLSTVKSYWLPSEFIKDSDALLLVNINKHLNVIHQSNIHMGSSNKLLCKAEQNSNSRPLPTRVHTLTKDEPPLNSATSIANQNEKQVKCIATLQQRGDPVYLSTLSSSQIVAVLLDENKRANHYRKLLII